MPPTQITAASACSMVAMVAKFDMASVIGGGGR